MMAWNRLVEEILNLVCFKRGAPPTGLKYTTTREIQFKSHMVNASTLLWHVHLCKGLLRIVAITDILLYIHTT